MSPIQEIPQIVVGVGVEDWVWSAPHSGRVKNMMTSGFRSDLILILGPEKTKVSVHRVFLVTGSRVLDSRILESEKTLVIADVDTRIFKLMLQYLYTGDSGAEMADALPLLKMATDFEVDELRDQCATLLKSDLTLENVLPLFQGAMEYAHKELIQSTLKYICRWGYKMIKRQEFANLRLECLVEIIQQDNLRVTDEMSVFEAVYRWGEAECGQKGLDGSDMKELRKVLDKPLKYIRFPLMDKEEFALKVANKNILNMSELTTLLTCFLISAGRRNVLPAGRFSSTPRTYVDEGIAISRFSPNLENGVAVPRQMTSSPPMESIMIRSEDDDAILSGLSIWRSIFDVKGPNYTYYYDNTIRASLTLKYGEEILLQLDNQTLVENGEFLDLKMEPTFTLPKGVVVELNIVISGTVGYSDLGVRYRQNEKTLHNIDAVRNYGHFQEEPTFEDKSLQIEFKRKERDPLDMAQGLIEKFTFAAV